MRIVVASSAARPLFREELGAVLRDRRRDRGDRLSDVAERAGISTQYLSEIERGRKDPSSEMIEAVAGALDTSVGDLAVAAGLRMSPARTDSVRAYALAA